MQNKLDRGLPHIKQLQKEKRARQQQARWALTDLAEKGRLTELGVVMGNYLIEKLKRS
jgi:hypothetical protein